MEQQQYVETRREPVVGPGVTLVQFYGGLFS